MTVLLQEEYNPIHGGKWTVKNLQFYLEGTRGKEACVIYKVLTLVSYFMMFFDALSFTFDNVCNTANLTP